MWSQTLRIGETPPAQDLKDEYSFNPDGSRKLLAEAGYPNGFDNNVYIPNDQDAQLIQVIKSYFADIGVDMKINQDDQNVLVATGDAGLIDQMSFSQYSDLIFSVTINYMSRTTMYRVNSVNADTEATAFYDDLFKQFTKVSDEETAKKLGRQMEEFYLRQHWVINTTERRLFDISQPHLKGFNGEELMSSYFRVWFWTGFWIDQT